MCGAHRLLDVAVIACAVQIVFAVSGFAQSNSGNRATTTIDRTVGSALREYVVSRPQEVWPEAVPPNLEPGIYLPVVQEMLKRSPTFRRQCWRITTASELVVTLQPGSRPMVTRVRARTRISRDGHRLVAYIEIFSPDQAAELIAHELEHVIEQLDGVDLASKADAAMSGVRRGEAPELGIRDRARHTRRDDGGGGGSAGAGLRRRCGRIQPPRCSSVSCAVLQARLHPCTRSSSRIRGGRPWIRRRRR